MSDEKIVSELMEDMEVVGPGKMLAEARELLGLTQEQVADKLNFRITLVSNIEAEIFNHTLPETFNRGYLRNYAKLVKISEEDVLTSYEALNVAEKQYSEMQSFSKGTEKQAESNRIMWISYLILAVLVGSTIVWWLQDSKLVENTASTSISKNTSAAPSEINDAKETEVLQPITKDEVSLLASDSAQEINSLHTNITTLDVTDEISTVSTINSDAEIDIALSEQDQFIDDNSDVLETLVAPSEPTTFTANEDVTDAEITEVFAPAVDVIFTFSGDCWVNIYDATGEHIAWGIKKSGYVMKISAVPPLSVTLGKPELVAINFDDQVVDTSNFNAGNIAKFTLPLAP